MGMEHAAPFAWKRPPQLRLALDDELIVDNFAGGGGASMGIEMALGRGVDIAINHDPQALAMHEANHPHTRHYQADVFEVDPVEACGGKRVGLAWFSPDCKHFSKAKGARPVDRKIRSLAWVAVRWAKAVRPRVIILENVEEFQDWGPLLPDGRPCPARKGLTFRRFVRALEAEGYAVDWRELRACDYGAPTIRKRLFLIARCDGAPIVWPEPTHGDPSSRAVRNGRLSPWLTAAECIDWSHPCPSIFERPRPLAENTLRRIARGIHRFVLEAAEPFIVKTNHTADGYECFRGQGLREPMQTVTAHANGAALVVPSVGTRRDLVAAFLAKHYGGNYTGPGWPLNRPISTVTARDHHALVAAMLAPYYGSGSGTTGRDLRLPVPTVTTRDRLQLVTVSIDGRDYVLTDIGMRMLQPRELYRAQGFPDEYVIAPRVNGRPLSKSAQVRMCGNSVSPVLARHLVEANCLDSQRRTACGR